MYFPRLCLFLPSDHQEIDSPPPPPPSVHAHHRNIPTFSSFLRRLHIKTKRRCFTLRPCCFSYLTTSGNRRGRRGQSSSVFSDIPGPDKTSVYENPRLFSYAELYIGSNGFSDKGLLGAGGFGRVYRAVLPSDGTIVAVKCVVNGVDRFEKTFLAELAAVAQLRHRNLVCLRGWCVHDSQLLLVYDYMPNGSLDRILFSSSSAKEVVSPLGWRQRERIVAGLAAALFYLHEQLDTQIIHRDVKTSNVMLDSGYNAKLGDFGLARWLEHETAKDEEEERPGELDLSTRSSSLSSTYQFRLTSTSKIGGTIGYLPPETFHKKTIGSVAVTAKSDVFSFGIVVLEVATGRRAVDLSYPDDEIVMVDWVRRLVDEGKCTKAGDRRLPEGSYSSLEMSRMIHLGLLCSLHDQSSRPTMKWVMEILNGNYAGDLPPLPSFKSNPYFLSLSSSTNSTSVTTTMASGAKTRTRSEQSFPNYQSALNSTIYLTANNGSDSNTTTPKHYPPPVPVVFPEVDTPREISFKEILTITNNFSESNIVAELDFGTGYHGQFRHSPHRQIRVLIKRLGMKTCPALRTRFSDELRNLGKLRHRNLVQLRGWCTEQGEMLVVYDHPLSSTLLSRRLFSPTTATILPWRKRYNILKSLASAILYLHEEWEEQVIHRNITSSAIFLDKDANPRLGSFALAEFLARNDPSHNKTPQNHDLGSSVRGIFGYIAPEYMTTGVATTMADVYSFGVVTLEVVTGQMAVDFRWPEVLLVRKLISERSIEGEALVDWRLKGDYDLEELRRVIEIGVMCTCSAAEERPTMREIVSVLDGNEEVLVGLRRRRGEGRMREGKEEWIRSNGRGLSLIRRIHAIGIH